MTPEQRLREQEELAYKAEQKKKSHGDDGNYEVEEDEAEAFDKNQAEMELKRASLSAQTCGDVVESKDKKGVVDINIVFVSDGSVKEATIAAPYADGPISDCIRNAYEAVIVPPFKEQEYSMSWQLDLSGKKNADQEKSAKLQKKIFGGKDDEEGKDDKKKKSKKKKK